MCVCVCVCMCVCVHMRVHMHVCVFYSELAVYLKRLCILVIGFLASNPSCNLLVMDICM